MDQQTFKEQLAARCREKAMADPKFAAMEEEGWAILEEYFGEFIPGRLIDLIDLPANISNLLVVTVRVIEATLDKDSPMNRLLELQGIIMDLDEHFAALEQSLQPMLQFFRTYAETEDMDQSLAHESEDIRPKLKTGMTTMIDLMKRQIAELEQDAGGPVTIAELLTSKQVTVMGL